MPYSVSLRKFPLAVTVASLLGAVAIHPARAQSLLELVEQARGYDARGSPRGRSTTPP
uniref:hypothetical protein n=1 Tax=Diaphorobacter aerolatus TaxID=1288495 RepID=UPI00384BBB3C